MQIRSLAFRGVGPYRDRQEIDFDQLGSSGLYLINGPTGAGKSTIIDCITFALYGDLSDKAADKSRLRSDFAGDSDRTEVDLVFETSAGTFRVIRAPEFMRAKKQGSGLTKSHATCTLIRVLTDGTEETVATTTASANAELQRVLGLTREQFVQTVVLPQGKFATFLHADTRERAEVLKRIFNTEVFERVVEILTSDAARVREGIQQATGDLVAEIRHLGTLLSVDEDRVDDWERLAADGLDEALAAGVETLLPALTQAHEAALQALATAKSQLDSADEARRLAERELAAREKVQAATESWRVAHDSVQRSEGGLLAYSSIAAEMGIVLDDTPGAETWRDRQSAAERETGALSALAGVEERLARWPQERTDAELAIEALREQLQEGSQRLSELPGLISGLEVTSQRRPSAEEIASSQGAKAELAQIAGTLDDIDSEMARRPDVLARVSRTRDAAAATADAFAVASAHYRASIAVVLAEGLEPGVGCPVCGAVEHPSPASSRGDVVTADDVEVVLSQLKAAEAEHAAATTTLAESETRIAELRSGLTMDRDQLTAAQIAWAETDTVLGRRAREAEEAENALVSARAEQQTLIEAAEKRRVRMAALEGELKTRDDEAHRSAQDVSAARGTYPTVHARAEALAAFARVLGEHAKALDALALADSARQAAEDALGALPDREGFADVTAAEAAWKSRQEEHAEVEAARRDAEVRLAHLRARAAAIRDLCAARARLGEQGRETVILADLFAAGRGSDIGLHIFVLKALFENVMESANRRLESLLNGRYRLVPSPDDEGDQRSLQGLGVSVEDRMTGKTRPAKSLSGGETFCASLALALGLSDVVRMNAGGIEIRSLFIDEGFGSLDPAQLDDVMLMLGHLSSDGRRVGLITHVESMKSAIAEQIDIIPASDAHPASLTVTWMEGS